MKSITTLILATGRTSAKNVAKTSPVSILYGRTKKHTLTGLALTSADNVARDSSLNRISFNTIGRTLLLGISPARFAVGIVDTIS